MQNAVETGTIPTKPMPENRFSMTSGTKFLVLVSVIFRRPMRRRMTTTQEKWKRNGRNFTQ